MYHSTPSRLLTRALPPASEPVTLSEAKLYLRVDGNSEDSLINTMITTVREAAEEYLRKSLITQSWKLAFDDYAEDGVYLPRGPVQAISSVVAVDSEGAETEIDEAQYYLNAARDKLCFNGEVYGFRVEIVYAAGFGAAAASVPAAIRLGLMTHLAALYDARGGDVAIPASAVMLYQPYREVRL